MKIVMQKIIDFGLLATFVIFPLVINISLISPNDLEHPIIAVNLSLADMVIGLLLILWFLKTIYYNEWRLILLPPKPVLAFAGLVTISFVNAVSLSEWIKETIQMIEYFVLFYLLVLNNLNSINRKTILYVFYLSASINILVAFVQHSFFNADVYLVRGLFESQNFLGAFMCMAVPLIYSEFIRNDSVKMKLWMSILLILSLFVLVSGSALFAIVISLAVVSWKYNKKLFIKYILTLVFILSIYPFLMPTKNLNAIKQFLSIYEQGSISQNYYKRLAIIGDFGKSNLLTYKFGENEMRVTTQNISVSKTPEIQTGERYKEMEGVTHLKNRYLEMQASLNLISEHTLLGVGAGNFQNFIGSYYKELPKINTAEPGQHNSYLIIAATMGILGLACLLWLFFVLIRNTNITDNGYVRKCGLFGAVSACMIECFFVDLFSASLMVPFILVMFLSLDNSTQINEGI